MSNLKIASRWAKRWSRYFTDATNSRIRIYLMPREYGKTYMILQRLKKPKIIRSFKKLAMNKSHRTCSRKRIKGRGC